VDVLAAIYAPIPARSLPGMIGRLRYAVPHLQNHLKGALQRAKLRLSRTHAGGIDWYWPAGEPGDAGTTSDGTGGGTPAPVRTMAPLAPSGTLAPWHSGTLASWHPVSNSAVRLLAPFDPIVWDRARFELLWGWAYRFEAYTPIAKRKLGYYALPLLWQDRVIGWGNVSAQDGALRVDLGFVGRRPADRTFRRELEAEIARMQEFLRPA
jgi:hypothetical protein